MLLTSDSTPELVLSYVVSGVAKSHKTSSLSNVKLEEANAWLFFISFSQFHTAHVFELSTFVVKAQCFT